MKNAENNRKGVLSKTRKFIRGIRGKSGAKIDKKRRAGKKGNNFKITVWAALIVLLVFLILTFIFGIGIYRFNWKNRTTEIAKKIFPYPAAFVSAEMIPISELDKQTSYIKFFYEKTSPDQIPSMESIEKQVLDRMVEVRTVKKVARFYGVVVSGSEIDEQYGKIVEENGGEEKVEQILSDLYGLDVKTFKELIGDQLLKEKLREKFENDLQFKVKVRHILQKIPKGKKTITVKKVKKTITGEEWAKRNMETIMKKINEGGDFGELAKKYSQDEASAKEGGVLPEIAKGDTVEEFENAAFSLSEPGNVSDIIKTDFGLHIIKLEEKKGKINLSFEDWLKEKEDSMWIWRLVGK